MQGGEPGLPALVMNLAVGAELGEGVIKSLVGCAGSRTTGSLRGCVKAVERGELLVKSIAGVDVHPLKRAARETRLQAYRTAEEQQLAGGQRGQHALPVDKKLGHAKKEDHRLSVEVHVCRRGDELRVDEMEVADQLAGDVTAVPDSSIEQRTRVLHDREFESGMSFRFLLHE